LDEKDKLNKLTGQGGRLLSACFSAVIFFKHPAGNAPKAAKTASAEKQTLFFASRFFEFAALISFAAFSVLFCSSAIYAVKPFFLT
jgi:hypothetical protein